MAGAPTSPRFDTDQLDPSDFRSDSMARTLTPELLDRIVHANADAIDLRIPID